MGEKISDIQMFSSEDFVKMLKWAFNSHEEDFIELYRNSGVFNSDSGELYAINKWHVYKDRGFEYWFCNLDSDTQFKMLCWVTGRTTCTQE